MKFRLFASDHDVDGEARPLVTAADIYTADACAVALTQGRVNEKRVVTLVDYSHYTSPEIVRIYVKGCCIHDARM